MNTHRKKRADEDPIGNEKEMTPPFYILYAFLQNTHILNQKSSGNTSSSEVKKITQKKYALYSPVYFPNLRARRVYSSMDAAKASASKSG